MSEYYNEQKLREYVEKLSKEQIIELYLQKCFDCVLLEKQIDKLLKQKNQDNINP